MGRAITCHCAQARAGGERVRSAGHFPARGHNEGLRDQERLRRLRVRCEIRPGRSVGLTLVIVASMRNFGFFDL